MSDLEGLRRKIYRRSHSLGSQLTFDVASKKFEVFLSSKKMDLDSIIQRAKAGDLDVYDLLDEFVTFMDDQGLKAKTTRNYFSWAKKILRHHGVNVSNEIAKERIQLPRVQRPQDEKVSLEDARRLLLACKNERLKLLLMLSKDTGARPVEILGLRLKDLNLDSEPASMLIPAYLAKGDMERELFLTEEALSVLNDYLRRYDLTKPEQFLFLDEQIDPIEEEQRFQEILERIKDAMETAWRRLLEDKLPDLNRRIPLRGVSPRYRLRLYSFRKFFFSKAADVLGELAAHALVGHESYLITYYKKTREERLKDFDKLRPELLIFKGTKQEVAEDVEEMKRRIEYLETLLQPETTLEELEAHELSELPDYLKRGYKYITKTKDGGVLLEPPRKKLQMNGAGIG